MALLLNGYQSFHWQAKPEFASMWNANGDRVYHIPIVFTAPFDKLPNVVVSCHSLDCDHGTNTRYTLSAEAVTKLGFNLVLNTWSDTHIWQISAAWFAYESRLSTVQADIHLSGDGMKSPPPEKEGSHSPANH
ncbi:H-type lectin domain-containing protein [Sphingomonas sp.]|uniref:H-type lectin domain-containing protein n=1 Tax=Sphingomonas sp. TaxID=28214 RepID=UPI0025FD33E3|nr:H-type lectin domain-containing protein [Sphingomonas sp.]